MSKFSRLKKKLLSLAGLGFSETKAYKTHFLKRKNSSQKKVVIFGQGRTGSTLLESLISSTGYFDGSGELLAPTGKEIKYPYYYISGLSKKSKNFLFHLKVYHLGRDREKPVDAKNFIKKLYKDGWYIIFLERQNVINHAFSNVIAEQRKSYHRTTNVIEKLKFEVDCVSLKKVSQRE